MIYFLVLKSCDVFKVKNEFQNLSACYEFYFFYSSTQLIKVWNFILFCKLHALNMCLSIILYEIY